MTYDDLVCYASETKCCEPSFEATSILQAINKLASSWEGNRFSGYALFRKMHAVTYAKDGHAAMDCICSCVSEVEQVL